MASEKLEEIKDRLLDLSANSIHFAEFLIIVFLVILTFIGIAYLFSQLYIGLTQHGLLDEKAIYHFINIVLVIFIIVEIFRIAVAYLVEEGVFYAVVEAALVAVGRQIVIYKYSSSGIYGAIALSILMLVLVGATYVFHRSRAEGLEESMPLKKRKQQNKA